MVPSRPSPPLSYPEGGLTSRGFCADKPLVSAGVTAEDWAAVDEWPGRPPPRRGDQPFRGKAVMVMVMVMARDGGSSPGWGLGVGGKECPAGTRRRARSWRGSRSGSPSATPPSPPPSAWSPPCHSVHDSLHHRVGHWRCASRPGPNASLLETRS